MGRQADREEFVSLMTTEGIPLGVARVLMHASSSLRRIAELECSSEAADRDRVPCPARRAKSDSGWCLCRDYGAYDGAQPDYDGRVPRPAHFWRHGNVPLIVVKGHVIRKHVENLCQAHGLVPVFNGDPRGAVLKVKVPSGRTNDWGQTGVCVP